MLPKKADLEAIIVKAGEILLSHFNKKIEFKVKDKDSIVTVADIESENFLKAQLKSIFPQAGFYAEESGGDLSSEYCWVIDPLDGTSNFFRGIPYFNISVALTRFNEPMIGIIYDPIKQEMFYAESGMGILLNGSKIQARKVADSPDKLICTEFAYSDEVQYVDKILHLQHKAREKSIAIRILGAAALDIAYLAAGRLDGIFWGQLCWWDIAAGMVLLQEIGLKCTDMHGNKLTPNFKSFVAGNEFGYKFIIDNLK